MRRPAALHPPAEALVGQHLIFLGAGGDPLHLALASIHAMERRPLPCERGTGEI